MIPWLRGVALFWWALSRRKQQCQSGGMALFCGNYGKESRNGVNSGACGPLLLPCGQNYAESVINAHASAPSESDGVKLPISL
jgi:hypothetical protein